ncbi:sporulation protein YunB [Bacillus piscicola]|uniref:sporulation protein YunB n=1 Tax=Bacillus piscicola TaxID=1632684 RepID=UPI001F09F8D3|nr:sporulation protein YunB [Bacillus piscicola]
MKKSGLFKRTARKKGPLPLRYILLISIILFFVLTVQGVWLVDQGIRPTLMAIARMETKKIATHAINDAISTKIIKNIDLEKMIDMEQDNDGRITSVNFNPKMYNQVLAETTIRVHDYLQMVEDGKVEELGLSEKIKQELQTDKYSEKGIIHYIPLGQATNNALLAQLGPRIPVRFSAIGDVSSTMSESIMESGINNTYLRVSIDIKVDVRIVIPFATDTAEVSTSVPIGMVFVSGEVPEFYNAGDGEMPAPAILQQSEMDTIMNIEEE